MQFDYQSNNAYYESKERSGPNSRSMSRADEYGEGGPRSSRKEHSTVYMVNGDRYLGDWKGNQKHGKGLYFSKKSGSIYQGEWQNDKRHGFGTLSLRLKSISSTPKHDEAAARRNASLGGSAVDELTVLFSQLSSQGLGPSSTNNGPQPSTRLINTLKKVYAGNWQSNQRHGFGTSFEKDGSTYEGEWKHNFKSGWGVMHFENGSRYEGEWFMSKRHGQGMFIHVNGDRYEGMWFNDLKEGPGKFIYKEQRRCYQGEWSLNLPKCGTLVDLPPARNVTQLELYVHKHPIPRLQLKDPAKVLDDEKKLLQDDRIRRLWPTNHHHHHHHHDHNEGEEEEGEMEEDEQNESENGLDEGDSDQEDDEQFASDDEKRKKNEELLPFLVQGNMAVDSHSLHEKMQKFHLLEEGGSRVKGSSGGKKDE